MSERTRKDYPRPKFEQRVKELTSYKGYLYYISIFKYFLFILSLFSHGSILGDGNVDLTPVIEDYKDALFSWWPLTRYQLRVKQNFKKIFGNFYKVTKICLSKL